MEAVILKLLGGVFAPFNWLYALCVDQTRIDIVSPHSATACPSKFLLVHDSGHRGGLMLFAVTTRSRRPVEITRVEIRFPSSLQLLDPGGRGFFKIATSLEPDLPFQVSWDGSASVRRGVQQAFALGARFPDGVNEYPIRMTVCAYRVRSASGGFRFHGRLRVTTKGCRVLLTQQQVLGLPVPPNAAQTTPQPFLIEATSWVQGGQGPIVAHEIFTDGTTSSERIDLPSA
jgi:hypothetical protein